VTTLDDLVLPAQYTTGDVLVRAATVEDVDAEKRIIDCVLMTYEREAQIDADLYEIFAPGAFKAAVGNPSRVKVSDQQHERRTVVGQDEGSHRRMVGGQGLQLLRNVRAVRPSVYRMLGAQWHPCMGRLYVRGNIGP
jgi:hypothetical protein